MANFKTHFIGGITTGTRVIAAGIFTNYLTLTQAGAIFILGVLSGLLSDLDNDTGKPLASLEENISADACNMIGRSLHLMDKNLLAIPFYLHALALNSYHPYAGANLSVALQKVGD